MKVFAALALFIGAASAVCPNQCSGHGTCSAGDACVCFPNWQAADCSARTCPFAISWIAAAEAERVLTVPAGAGMGGRHAYTECSSKGICDRSSGVCQCFEGYEGKGCRRTACPNKCSGHGRCVYNRDAHSQTIGGLKADLNGYNGFGLDEFTSVMWDAHKSQQCLCDRGWEDVDCSSRICPKGDDPLSDCNTKNQKDDVQLILFRGNTDWDLINNQQFFSLTFTDMFNGNYTTYPIQLQQQATASGGALCGGLDTTTDTCFKGTAEDIALALRKLPNFAIPSVTVTFENMTKYRHDDDDSGGAAFDFDRAKLPDGWAASRAPTPSPAAGWGASDDHGTYNVLAGFMVTFTDAATSGYQNSLDCYIGSRYDSDEPGVQPRFGLGGAVMGASCAVYHVGEPTNNDRFGSSDGQSDAFDNFKANATNSVDASNKGWSGFTGKQSADISTTPNDYGYSNTLLNDVVPYDSISSYKEHATCSSRGVCDGSTGLCACFEGHTGEACAEQTVFM